jgi:AcrR family transcriptional regulator
MIISTPRSPRKAKGRGEERRQEILDAALGLFSKRGLYGVSTREIAAEVGISQPALYAYFRSSDDIASVLAQQAFHRLKEWVESALVQSAPGVPLMRRLCEGYIRFGLDNPDAYRMAFMLEKVHSSEHGREAGDRVLTAGVDTFAVFRRNIDWLVANGLTYDGNPERLGQVMWATLHGLTSLLIARATFPWIDQASLIEAQIDSLLRGIVKPESHLP